MKWRNWGNEWSVWWTHVNWKALSYPNMESGTGGMQIRNGGHYDLHFTSLIDVGQDLGEHSITTPEDWVGPQDQSSPSRHHHQHPCPHHEKSMAFHLLLRVSRDKRPSHIEPPIHPWGHLQRCPHWRLHFLHLPEIEDDTAISVMQWGSSRNKKAVLPSNLYYLFEQTCLPREMQSPHSTPQDYPLLSPKLVKGMTGYSEWPEESLSQL